MMTVMSRLADAPDHAAELLRLYDDAVGEVYRYLRVRCGDRHVAEDLTADTFLAAVGQVQRRMVTEVSVAWLVGIARHKLVDHWRRRGRRSETPIEEVPERLDGEDLSAAVVDRHRVEAAMAELGEHHRSVLVLRYYDGLTVPEVADLLGRTVHATEALLVRARRRFRVIYDEQAADDDRSSASGLPHEEGAT
jgi:RNA polymerase sigma-70 factor (ECF subfamily)